jgi:8-oxo-dGTP pyrophosphatase MutT (NUDIX family)
MVRAGAVIFYAANGGPLILLVKSSNPDFGGSDWQVPKGVVDGDESWQEAAIREAEEEAGLIRSNISSINFLCDYNSIEIFAIQVFDPLNFNRPGYETSEVKWFTLSNAFKAIRKFQIPYLGKFVHFLKVMNVK